MKDYREDVQVTTFVLPDAVMITRNTGELNSKGAEVELKALLFQGLEFTYDFGYTDASYDRLAVAGMEGRLLIPKKKITGKQQLH